MSTARDVATGDVEVAREKGHARYWTQVGDRVVIADSLADLVAVLDSPRLSAMGMAAIAQRRGGIWLTPFDGVHRLTFGHQLVVTPHGAQVQRWLTPERDTPTHRNPIEVMRTAIEQSVAQALGGNERAMLTLSSGLDSTTVAAFAARYVNNPAHLRAFCAVSMTALPTPRPGREWNEWPLAESVARQIGVTAEAWVNDGADHWLDCADELHVRHHWPVPAWGNVWWMRKAEREAVAAGYRVILTGQSGNATYSVGPAGLPAALDASPRRTPRAVAGRWWRRWREPMSAHRTDVAVELPAHWQAMDRWTRWCLSEPPYSNTGPWTDADVQWSDPLGSERVIRAAMSLPPNVWSVENGRRALARAVSRGLVPDAVVDSRLIGKQGADLPHLIHSRADHYEQAIERVCESPSAAMFLNLNALRRSVPLLHESDASAQLWADHYLGALSAGLFTAWWDSR